MSYGVFVKLEEGLEGLVHISEISWTKRLNHPSEMVSLGEEVNVVVLGTNKEKQEISLGMKQAQDNPWTLISQKHPPGSVIEGRVRNLTNYGAFIEVEEGIDGLLHVSDMSWTRRITHPSEILKKGQTVKCMVLNVNQDKSRVGLGLKQLTEDPWERAIPEKYVPGQIVQGKAVKITTFGVFLELEPELEGLLHISELADQKVENPEDVVSMGQALEVKILRVDVEDRKIGLSLKRVGWTDEDAEGEQGEQASAPPAKLRGGLHGPGDLGSDLISYSVLSGSQPAQLTPAATPESQTPAEQEPPAEEPAAVEPEPITPAQLPPEETDSQSSAESAQPSEPEDKPTADLPDTTDDTLTEQQESSPPEAADDDTAEQKDESTPSSE